MNSALPAAAVAFVTACVLTPLFRGWARRRGLLDVPNDASSHQIPTPRNGGFAVVLGILAGTAAAGGWRDQGAVLIGCAFLVAAFAAIDEFKPLPRMSRLVGQIALAVLPFVLAPSLGPSRIEVLPLSIFAIPFGVLWLVGATNGFNFMDGLNGLASSAAIVSGVTIAILGSLHGDAATTIIGAAIAAAAAGFVPWNLPSGSIFMGDVGSATLGFLIGLCVLHLTRIGVPFLAAALPLLSFVSDAFLAVVRRALKGERFFATRHKSHFYQRLNQTGWSHAAVTGTWTVMMALTGVAAVLYDRMPSLRVMLIVAVVLLHAAVFGTIAVRHQRWAPR
jgi:UDP-GlcNAc:undecaprenyl-phosphate/decaprenyl-phosphate GlcNAc-1-phosphate transferase